MAFWSSIVTNVNKTSECHSCVWRANWNSSALQLRRSPWGVRTNCSGYQVTWKHKHNICTETCKISWVGGDSSACWLGNLSVGKKLNFAFLQEVNQTTYLLVPELLRIWGLGEDPRNLPVSNHLPFSSHCLLFSFNCVWKHWSSLLLCYDCQLSEYMWHKSSFGAWIGKYCWLCWIMADGNFPFSVIT